VVNMMLSTARLHTAASGKTTLVFWLFALTHLLFWTGLAAFVRGNLPMDSIEGSMWGQHLALGYDKNPFLNGWLTALLNHLSHHSSWLIYFFSQLSVFFCFLAVWLLAKKMLTPAKALASVMLLEMMQYYNFHAIDFNDNTLELSLWALAIYFFYQALINPRIRWWLATGLFLALGMMAKYYTAVLIAVMFAFMLYARAARWQFATVKPYYGLLVFLAIIAPHFLWLPTHHYITIQYALDRTNTVPDWRNHFFFPAQFIWQQIEVFLPAAVLFGLCFFSPSRAKAQDPASDVLNRSFLLFTGLGPCVLTLLLSLCFGWDLRAGWGMPLLSLWGVLLFVYLPTTLNRKRMQWFIALTFILMGCLGTGYALSLLDSNTPSSANFPGQTIANTVTQIWHNTYHTRLTYVAGPRWVNGNVAFYAKDHPSVYSEWNNTRAFWIDIAQLKQAGAVFLWNISNGETLPAPVRVAFPTLQQTQVLTFSWQHNHHHLAPIEIGMAILPPAS